mgnify:CR=1 FL=1
MLLHITRVEKLDNCYILRFKTPWSKDSVSRKQGVKESKHLAIPKVIE